MKTGGFGWEGRRLTTVALGLTVSLALRAADFTVVGKGDGRSVETAALQAAVDAAEKAGGGRVVVPAGVWKSGTVRLGSNVELHLEKGAVILGSTEAKDYNANDAFPENFHSAGEEWSGGHLVYAYRAENVAITGEGVIDGNGPAFFGECDYASWYSGYKYGVKLHPLDREWFRPGPMVAMFLTKGIRIEGVTFKNTPCWTCHLRCCDGVDVRGVTIDADRTIANSDGFSIDCTRNVKIRGCTVKTGDDAFAIRASCRHHAATNSCEHVEIEDCDVWSCAMAVRLGVGTGTVRDVKVRNLRSHEGGFAGVEFTTAWTQAARNCFIEDVEVKDCTFRETGCPVAIGMAANGESRVRNVLFENCVFESLEPVKFFAGKCRPENVVFRNCERKYLKRLKVRQDKGWEMDNAGRRDRRFHGELGDCRDAFTFENCLPAPLEDAKGVLLLSFDDRNFAGWKDAVPLFAKYGAHATFFVSGEIDNAAASAMKYLLERGHTVGLHGLHHANADAYVDEHGEAAYWEHDLRPQVEKCILGYVDACESFAYPNCRWNEGSERVLKARGFKRTRASVKGATPYDPTGVKQKDRKPLVTNEAVFLPMAKLPETSRFDCILMGESYHTDVGEILACVRRIAEKREVLTICSHNIGPDAKRINMKTEWLERILAEAKKLGVAVVGFDELPTETGATGVAAGLPEFVTEPGTMAKYWRKKCHVQGIACSPDAVYLGYQYGVFKYAWDGRFLKHVEAPCHTGDVFWYRGKLYTSVDVLEGPRPKRSGVVQVYDGDLNLLKEKELAQGIDGICAKDGILYLGMNATNANHRVNQIGRMDAETLEFLGRVDIDTGYDTSWGTQDVTTDGERFWVQFYSERPLAVFDADFRLLKTLPFRASNGFDYLPANLQGARPRFAKAETVQGQRNADGTWAEEPRCRIRFFEFDGDSARDVTLPAGGGAR